jgi:NAD(P)H dehydrogenase (quinone)
MKNLIVVGHPDKKSFCYNGIFKTIQDTLKKGNNEEIQIIDLYKDDLSIKKKEVINHYQELVTWADRIYIISPVWWFRCTPLMEEFFDVVFTPGFAYKFIPLFPKYGYPKPLLSHKKVRTYLTHGAPSLPVYLLYFNAVKLRLVLGVYSFVFGWFKTKTRQFWSVPFVDEHVRIKYLKKVTHDVLKDLKCVGKNKITHS